MSIAMNDEPFTFLCFASYEKGHDFMRQAKRDGCRVYVLTSLSLKEKARWPLESIDEIFYMPDDDHTWNRDDTLKSVAFLARERRIDCIVPLDEFDQEIGAAIRAHLLLSGMDETTMRGFRDKLYMRRIAEQAGLRVPPFIGVLNYAALHRFTEQVPPPWMLKPRLMAGAIGIQKIDSAESLWSAAHALLDEQSYYLLEKYLPGNVCHVDSIVWNGEIVFQIASAYGRPPLDVSHGGGVFTTSVLPRGGELEQSLLRLNRKVLSAMRHVNGVSHAEFIVGREDGEIYFLEIAARVGGAHIGDLVEAASGLNLWAEWARVERATPQSPYTLPPVKDGYASLIVSLAREEHPDLSGYNDPEVVWRMDEAHHAGLIVAGSDHDRVGTLRDQYVERIANDFGAVLPPKSKPTS